MPPAPAPIVGVDGGDGAGKTCFADYLAAHVRGLGRSVIRASVDDFHSPRAIRYRRGRDDPGGFFKDSFDLVGLTRRLIDPFRAGAPRFRVAAFDHLRDAPALRWVDRPDDGVLIVDGLFLHRDELASVWSLSLFLDVSAAERCARLAARDGTSPDPQDPSNRRYVDGCEIYFAASRPAQRASVVIDNSDWDYPKVASRPARSSAP